MKKFLTGAFMLAAISTFSVGFAPTASAEATLLAEWLINSFGVTALTSIKKMLFKWFWEDATFGAGIECEAESIGSVGPDGEAETTQLLSKSGVEVTLAKPLTLSTGCKIAKGCESAAGVEVAPEELPWHLLLYLDEISGDYLLAVRNDGLSAKCRILFVTATDECKTENGAAEVLASSEGAEETGTVTPNGNCTVGGAGSGVEKFFGLGNILDLTGNSVIPSSQ
jgi:hypothetical protein